MVHQWTVLNNNKHIKQCNSWELPWVFAVCFIVCHQYGIFGTEEQGERAVFACYSLWRGNRIWWNWLGKVGSSKKGDLGPVVLTLDSAIHQVNLYPVNEYFSLPHSRFLDVTQHWGEHCVTSKKWLRGRLMSIRKKNCAIQWIVS